ncbi:MAG: hypothetical protein CMC70_06635 [Flavobacteriaceae bacterium]|nr:hypothetical protein [Flavobacteriaceae bacterium]
MSDTEDKKTTTEDTAQGGSFVERVIDSRQPDYTTSTETVKLTPEQEKARGRRNVTIAWSLVAFIVIVFLVTVVRLSQNIAAGAGA